MKRLLFALSVIFLIAACSPGNKKEASEDTTTAEPVEKMADPKLTKMWETDTVLTTCESVLYDETMGRLFVSNINGQPLEKNGEGFISILNLDGSVKTLKWAVGLNAPKGMGIHSDKLYVTDIDRIVSINLSDGSIAETFEPDTASFLNDITVADDKIYISDTNLGKIHMIANGELSTIKEGAENVNGLLAKDDQLLSLDGSGFKSYDLSDMSAATINSEVTGGDGLTQLNDSVYIASRWQGEIYWVSGNKATLLLDTKEQESQTADIALNAKKGIVYVPTFFNNRVVAYKLEY